MRRIFMRTVGLEIHDKPKSKPKPNPEMKVGK